MRTLKKHSEHHSKKHMDMMKKLMREGSSFKAAHNKAQKMQANESYKMV